jgi:hypothetical protein
MAGEYQRPSRFSLPRRWGGYNGLVNHEYTHNKTNLSTSGDAAQVRMPGVDRITSLLKQWLLGTYLGTVEVAPIAYKELVNGQ